MKRSLLSGAVFAAIVVAVTSSLSRADAANGLGLPATRPTSPATVALSSGCDNRDRPGVETFLKRVQDGLRRKDSAFREIDWHGARYVTFKLKAVGLTFDQFNRCLPVHFGTEAEARRIDLFVPANDTPIGVMLYTPQVGFYGDPRAFTTLGGH